MSAFEQYRAPLIAMGSAAALVFLYFGVRFQRRGKAVRSLLNKTWIYRRKRLHKLARGVITDVQEMLNDATLSPREARVLIPLVSETRKRLQSLSRHRKGSVFWYIASEEKTHRLLSELIRLEDLLRSIPRSTLSLEDVLAGRFEDMAVRGAPHA